MNLQVVIPFVSLLVLAVGLGIWQVAFVHARGALRSLFEMLDLLVFAAIIVTIIRLTALGYGERHIDYTLAVAGAFVASAPITSGVGRLRVPAALVFGAVFAVAFPFVTRLLEFPPLPIGAAMLGVLVVLGARHERDQLTEWQPAFAGALIVLLGLAMNDAVRFAVPPQDLLYLALTAAIGLVTAAPFAWLARGNRLTHLLAGGIAAALVSWTAEAARPEALLAAAVAGFLTGLIAFGLGRLKLDDATGSTSAFLGAGAASFLAPVRFSSSGYLHSLPANIAWHTGIVVVSSIAGFLLALLLQITIGLRRSE